MWSSFIINYGILSKNYKKQLIKQIVDSGNTTEYEILHRDRTESDSKNLNEAIDQLSDSCSDMNVDKAEQRKQLSIPKQEQIDRKHFCNYFHNDQNIIMVLKYKTSKLSWSET